MSSVCYSISGRVSVQQRQQLRVASQILGQLPAAHRKPTQNRSSFLNRHFSSRVSQRSLIAAASKDEEQSDPENFAYTHLWVSKDGETHIKEATMKGFDLKKFAAEPQFVKQGFKVKNLVFTEMAPGLKNDFHPCPSVQFVVCVGGSWYIKTTDGTTKTMKAGDILFQDNIEDSPADKPPSHFSGVEGDQPCQQVVIQVDRKAEVDNPGSL
ncbi:hypothetical protein WJX84_001433 [Apatococcus fuscideae]|uniref:Cupin 2 conserved barrel domain-containing protein n=1 Tax=Apatococcus fuscideae TaxID=2026836 RepID=A0AAW1TKF8_9CHLO